ncbi:MAG TPA: hypothetical protein VFE51_24565 [Verrucomicrobiae bacterium]|nr:hypothetical protein [Verrucomicrobiae bacterium]
MKISRKGVVLSSLPSVMSLGLFYSLALHMHQSLGTWPASIGERGFPRLLVIHANLCVYFFMALVLSGVFIVPAIIAVCLATPGWRHSVPYFVLYVMLFFACWGVMQFAPEPFLNWWRD